MSESVERTSFDLRYEGYRMRDKAGEARLLRSIVERGIEQPLEGVDPPRGRFLLNGFRRNRCAEKLGIDCVPYVSLGEEEANGIIRLMHVGRDNRLSILEQAKFVVELLTVHQMTVAQVAETLSRTKAWVSMRRSLLEEMSQNVQQILLRGDFPVYAYMYTLRRFMRMNSVRQEDGERFVKALAGQGLSIRQIKQLAEGYFRGPSSLREAVDQGKWSWSLEQINRVPEDPEGCNDIERALLKDLGILLKYIHRVMSKCHDSSLKSRTFHAQANLITAGLLGKLELFSKAMREFHDRSGQA